MRHYDLSPLYRSTIGFDRLFSLLDQSANVETAPAYPPYNIERTGDNAYRITLAVAGFAENDLTIETRDSTLSIKGSKEARAEGVAVAPLEVLHQGIAARAFERRFQLADHVKVTGATLEHGLLHVELLREVPEAAKPRQIAIASSGRKPVETIQAKKAA